MEQLELECVDAASGRADQARRALRLSAVDLFFGLHDLTRQQEPHDRYARCDASLSNRACGPDPPVHGISTSRGSHVHVRVCKYMCVRVYIELF